MLRMFSRCGLHLLRGRAASSPSLQHGSRILQRPPHGEGKIRGMCAAVEPDPYDGFSVKDLKLMLKTQAMYAETDRQSQNSLLNEKDETKKTLHNMLKQLAVQLADARKELLIEQSRANAVFDNHSLLEIGLSHFNNDFDPTGKWMGMQGQCEQFVNGEMLNGKGKLSQQAKMLHRSLVNSKAKQKDVAKELSQMSQNLRKLLRRPRHSMPGAGIFCGGEEPLATAVALCVLQLQSRGYLRLHVDFFDSEGKPLYFFVGGQVQLPREM